MANNQSNSNPISGEFAELYDNYFDRVFAYAGYRISGVQNVEDIVSEIFLKVFNNLEDFEKRSKSSSTTWIFRIAHNSVIDYLRRNGKSQDILSLDDENFPAIKSESLSPDEVITRREDYQEIFVILNSLALRQQEVITLKYFGNLKNKEIADVLGIRERTVAASLSRGLKELYSRYQRLQTAASQDQKKYLVSEISNPILRWLEKTRTYKDV